ncbi:hypothetical protein ACNJX9_34025 [Bradyrhizobium sp. DASA03076]|uniref:hypothetical protein n=1 Tax=Bradyrhizobium sp. BLXBL-03 TaxID=3395916 RepID=UPI003F708A74
MKRQRRSKYEGLNASDRARARIQFEGRTPDGHPLWTKEEDYVVGELFPDYRAMQRKLRRRSKQALYSRAMKLKLTRSVSHWTTSEIARLRGRWGNATKAELIAEFPRHSWDGIQGKGRTFGIRRRPWQPKLTGQQMLDAIRQRAADLRISLRDLDRTCAGRRYFANSSRRSQKPRRNVLLRAIAALGGRVEIVWR